MLLETTQKFAVDSEVGAKDMIEAFRAQAAEKGYKVKKASYEYKAKKSKGEVIAEKWVVTIIQVFTGLWDDLEG